ncbi:MAG: succinate--CoA ligase subunit alpha [Deltaproteobacteria bacterium]|nr:succinate--CoA ligase subunit alpha [Deltaproteobacteria bacterium]
MAILVNEDTQVLIQGITGTQGRYHTLKMLEYNVKVVGGVTPGKGGEKTQGLPVYDTVSEAKQYHRIDATMIVVPAAGVLAAAIEAMENNIPLIVIITEFVPLHDALKIRSLAGRNNHCVVVGPNTIGIISPERSKVGIMPGFIYSRGNVGIVSRSGTLTHEIASNLTYRGIGQSTCVGIGGDAVKKTDFTDVLEMFRHDEDTTKVIMIGEIGGTGEEIAAQYIKESSYPKEVVAYIAGLTAPREKRMGHAGAIISQGFGTPESKVKSLTGAGVRVAGNLDELLEYVQ